jgi:hypothetical protein
MRKYLILLLLAGFAMAQDKPKEAKYSCTASTDEQCPTAEWYTDFEGLMALQKKYAPPKAVADQMRGTAERLHSLVPKGFHFDGEKVKFVKDATAVAPPVPAPQVPEKK